MSFGVRRLFTDVLLLCCAAITASPTFAQTRPEAQPQNQDDVIRVNTELVQTDVMVFDKKGRFVGGLKPEQFALKIDNKPQTISFFEQVTSGKTSGNSREERKTGAPGET